eukprot:s119_g64.t1
MAHNVKGLPAGKVAWQITRASLPGCQYEMSQTQEANETIALWAMEKLADEHTKDVVTFCFTEIIEGPDSLLVTNKGPAPGQRGCIEVEFLQWTSGRELAVVDQLLTTLATLTMIGCLSFDILVGWDFDDEELRFLTVRLATSRAIAFIYCSPPCTMFSELTRLWNVKRMSAEVFQCRWDQAVVWVNHCMELCRLQVEMNRKFMFEHPRKASSWKLASVMSVARLPGVSIVHFDMCAVGMTSPLGAPVRKRTSIMTNSDSLVEALRKRQCPKNHVHRKIEGSELGHSMSKWSPREVSEAKSQLLTSCAALVQQYGSPTAFLTQALESEAAAQGFVKWLVDTFPEAEDVLYSHEEALPKISEEARADTLPLPGATSTTAGTTGGPAPSEASSSSTGRRPFRAGVSRSANENVGHHKRQNVSPDTRARLDRLNAKTARRRERSKK